MTAAPIIIAGDYGGMILDYDRRVEQWRHDGTKIEIRGPCASACTLVLSLPKDQLCAGPHAALGFHKPAGGSPFALAYWTEILWGSYPQSVREWITARGGLSDRVAWMTGREVTQRVRPCDVPEPWHDELRKKKQV